jgi:hypothetical protein
MLLVSGSQIRQTVTLTHLRRIEVLFGNVGSTEQSFLELTLNNASSSAESRLAVELMEPGAHLDIVGMLKLTLTLTLTW